MPTACKQAAIQVDRVPGLHSQRDRAWPNVYYRALLPEGTFFVSEATERVDGVWVFGYLLSNALQPRYFRLSELERSAKEIVAMSEMRLDEAINWPRRPNGAVKARSHKRVSAA